MRIPLSACLVEVSTGVGPTWAQYRLLGATRAGLAGGKEAIGKAPERYKLVLPGSIFYNPMRILLGSIAFLDEGDAPGITSPDYVVFEARKGVLHPRFFYHWLRSVEGDAFIRSLARGAVRERLLFRRLVSDSLDFPPWDVQKKTADQLAVVERARAAAEVRLEAAHRLSAAHLRVAFDSTATRDWPYRRLRDLAEIVSGITLGRKPPTDPVRPVAYLRVANVKDGYLALDDVYSIEASDSEIEKLCLRRGDLLLTEGGDPDKLGRGTFWEEQIQDCIHQNHIFRVRFETAVVLSEFAAAQVGSQYGKSYFLKHAKQTTGIATINQRVLGEFPFLLPPPEQQQAIIDRLRLELAAAKQVRAAAETEVAAINALPSALLRRAFSGEG